MLLDNEKIVYKTNTFPIYEIHSGHVRAYATYEDFRGVPVVDVPTVYVYKGNTFISVAGEGTFFLDTYEACVKLVKSGDKLEFWICF